MGNDDEEVEFRVESPNSSSDIIVRGTPHAIEITLDPMEHPIERLDVYPEDAEEFVEAVQKAGEVVDPEYWDHAEE